MGTHDQKILFILMYSRNVFALFLKVDYNCKFIITNLHRTVSTFELNTHLLQKLIKKLIFETEVYNILCESRVPTTKKNRLNFTIEL